MPRLPHLLAPQSAFVCRGQYNLIPVKGEEDSDGRPWIHYAAFKLQLQERHQTFSLSRKSRWHPGETDYPWLRSPDRKERLMNLVQLHPYGACSSLILYNLGDYDSSPTWFLLNF